MVMDKEMVGINCNGISYVVKRTNTEMHIEAKEQFVREMTNTLETKGENFNTVGGMNRNYLHKLLDEWIDNALIPRGE